MIGGPLRGIVLDLDAVVAQLDKRKRRATYGAVAGLVGGLPRGLMAGRPKNHFYSWVVAKTSGGESRRGWPTGYSSEQIHPDCLRQIHQGSDDIIEDESD